MPDDRMIEPVVEGRTRRSFVTRVAGAMAVWPFVRRLKSEPTTSRAWERAGQAPNATLLAIGDAILPTELGATGSTRGVVAFEQWMAAYRPGAEANHGYGTGKIERLPADPRPTWQAQLVALDAESRRRHGRSFAEASREQRQTIVRAALASERGEALPSAVRARHVALALLAHFYDSSEAADLCYDAAIGRQQCRPLDAQRQQPVAISRRSR